MEGWNIEGWNIEGWDMEGWDMEGWNLGGSIAVTPGAVAGQADSQVSGVTYQVCSIDQVLRCLTIAIIHRDNSMMEEACLRSRFSKRLTTYNLSDGLGDGVPVQAGLDFMARLF